MSLNLREVIITRFIKMEKKKNFKKTIFKTQE